MSKKISTMLYFLSLFLGKSGEIPILCRSCNQGKSKKIISLWIVPFILLVRMPSASFSKLDRNLVLISRKRNLVSELFSALHGEENGELVG
jgi:hypothetical protein